MKDRMIKYFLFLIFLLNCSRGLCGNDTDGIVAKGLFPLTPNSNLTLDNEDVQVIFKSTTLKVIREYKITNKGQEGSYQFGTMFCSNCTDTVDTNIKIYIDDNLTNTTTQTGYLRDEGTHVKSKDEFGCRNNCPKYTDGIICCHTWTQFEVDFESGETMTIRLEYINELKPSAYFVNQIIGELYLYTEKFWSNDTIPEIIITLEGNRDFVSVKHFIPQGRYAKWSIKPDIETENKLIWKFINHNPEKKMYRYTKKLVHPFSVDKEQICESINQSTKKIFCQ